MEDTLTELANNGITPTVEELVRLMQKYTHGDVFALAGYTGPDIQTSSEAQTLAANKGLSFEPRDKVQHGNMDQPTCGYGCSGKRLNGSDQLSNGSRWIERERGAA